MQKSAYQRVLLKISGEILMGTRGTGIDFSICHRIASLLHQVHRLGVEMAVVIGGGNLFRGASLQEIPRVPADQMGMLATLMNGIALGHSLAQVGCPHRILSAVASPFLESYSWEVAQRALHHKEFLLLVGGTSHPYFTTDSAAALRALEIQAQLVIKGTKVDGIYDKDPVKHVDAMKFERLTYAEVLARRLKVMDPTAITLCQEGKIPIRVVNIFSDDSLFAALANRPVGTLVEGE